MHQKRFLSKSYFRDIADMMIDCKKLDLSLTIEARQHADIRLAPGAYRKCSDSLKTQHVKPNEKRHRTDGGVTWVLAGVVEDKIRLWEDREWNCEVAAAMYRFPIKKVLAKHRAVKKIWTIVKDNDTAGFKS